jgi:hypothetical protein
MANGGVTTVLLRDRLFNTTSRYPKMLSQLAYLRSLSIDKGNERIGDAHGVGNEIEKLSPGLEELHLQFEEAEACLLLDKIDERPISHEENDDDRYSAASNESDGGHKQLRALGKIFPRLHTLKLKASRTYFDSDNLLDLPNSLTSLDLADSCLSSDSVAKLPRALLELSLSPEAEVYQKHVASSLPPNLRCLNHPSVFSEDSVTVAPRTLTSLEFSSYNLSQSSMNGLPPHITDLQLHLEYGMNSSAANAFGFLPKSLSRFSLVSTEGRSIGQTTGFFDAQTLQTLPRSLLHLRFLGPILNLASLTQSQWPPRLEKFEFLGRGCILLEPSFFGTLPKSIKDLSITCFNFRLHKDESLEASKLWTHSLDFLQRAYLPQLRTLELGYKGSPAIVPSDMKFPKSLKRLVLNFNFALNESLWQSLPVGLETFITSSLGHEIADSPTSISAKQPIVQGLEFLPPTLTKLKLEQFPGTVTINGLTQLPRELKVLEADLIKSLLSAEVINSLPRRLEKLLLTSAPIDDWRSVALLPQSLKTISISGGTEWPAEVLQDLPRGLLHLHIHCLDQVQNQHMTLLPPKLRTLGFAAASKLTATAVDYLPDSIQAYRGSHHRLSDMLEIMFESAYEAPLPCPDPRVISRYAERSLA